MAIMYDRDAGDSAFLNAIARSEAVESCVNCAGSRKWKTAALIHEGLQWNYYYCYECQGWFARHFRYRYLVAKVVDGNIIKALAWEAGLQHGEPYEVKHSLGVRSRLSSWARRLRNSFTRMS